MSVQRNVVSGLQRSYRHRRSGIIPLQLLASSQPSSSSVREFSSTASWRGTDRGRKGDKPEDETGDDLSDLDFSYEPYFERLGPAPGSHAALAASTSTSSSDAPSPPPQRDADSPPSMAADTGSRPAIGPAAAPRLTHVDPLDHSRARMVDVSHKAPTLRSGVAVGRVYLPQVAMDLIRASEDDNRHSSSSATMGRKKGGEKGPVLRTAQLAGIMGAKRTAELIPLCHPLSLSHVDVVLELVDLEAVDEEEEAREAEEVAALASSEGFLRQATTGSRNDSGLALGGVDGEVEQRGDFGFRIEDLMDGDRWRGKEFDINDAGMGGGTDFGNGGAAFGNTPSAGSNMGAIADFPSPTRASRAGAKADGSAARDSNAAGYVQVTCTARTTGPTGVEMEALVGANVACLTIWDMVKAVAGQTMWIGDVKVVKKTGGKSGDWEREG
ncbi:hypothetical protein CF327_g3168 [Tilletia walkeri]|uniref:Molybdopterin cofactor biosynthesis C (MoaC) domain-containing protein n=1 Tax=Tilletia walkeri TaxID=117179 RepID=A0A8X7NAK2_9BASI|nr:hypothetical protein CF327_g3168 [Tilletia walkeri]KAE8269483.1 hypothetical protein A4X09_0g2859 [Tilletia walkeri]